MVHLRCGNVSYALGSLLAREYPMLVMRDSLCQDRISDFCIFLLKVAHDWQAVNNYESTEGPSERQYSANFIVDYSKGKRDNSDEQIQHNQVSLIHLTILKE